MCADFKNNGITFSRKAVWSLMKPISIIRYFTNLREFTKCISFVEVRDENMNLLYNGLKLNDEESDRKQKDTSLLKKYQLSSYSSNRKRYI